MIGMLVVLGGCFAAAFVAGMLVTRRRLLVGLAIPALYFAYAVISDWDAVQYGDVVRISVYVVGLVLSVLAALAGVGLARLIRGAPRPDATDAGH